jgi:hypothetical protein
MPDLFNGDCDDSGWRQTQALLFVLRCHSEEAIDLWIV